MISIYSLSKILFFTREQIDTLALEYKDNEITFRIYTKNQLVFAITRTEFNKHRYFFRDYQTPYCAPFESYAHFIQSLVINLPLNKHVQIIDDILYAIETQ